MKKIVSLALILIASTVFAASPETHYLTINGKNIGVVIQGGTHPAATVPGQGGGLWAVSLEDLARAMGAPITLEPTLQLQGNMLYVRGASSELKYKQAGALNPASKIEAVQKIKYAPGQLLAVRKGGLVSSRVFMVNGKAYVPVQDLFRALGDGSVRGSFTGNLQPGQNLSLNFTRPGNERGIIAILIGL